MAAQILYIAKTKQGEFEALAHTRRPHKDSLLPLFDLSLMSGPMRRFADVPDITRAYIDEKAEKIGQVWARRSALIDAMRWPVNATIRSGEHILTYFHDRLRAQGVRVAPVIGYDRWESLDYRDAIAAMELPENPPIWLRLESEAIRDAADPEYLQNRITEILDTMLITTPEICRILLDFEDVSTVSISDLIERAQRIISAVAPLGFKHYATAGCSMPASIELAVPNTNSTGRVVRREWALWRALRSSFPQYSWIYGDYGVRGPRSADDIIAPHTNGKIRYTNGGGYFVARGHSLQLEDKGGQMHGLADTVINSPNFMGPEFSWGDSEIVRVSETEFCGNSTQWISFDTNHHIAWVIQEVEEYILNETQARPRG